MDEYVSPLESVSSNDDYREVMDEIENDKVDDELANESAGLDELLGADEPI